MIEKMKHAVGRRVDTVVRETLNYFAPLYDQITVDEQEQSHEPWRRQASDFDTRIRREEAQKTENVRYWMHKKRGGKR